MMRWTLPILMMLMAQDAAAQAAGGFRDVGEVFLSVPFPATRGPVAAEVAQRLATRAARTQALDEARADGRLTVDARNGYLELALPEDPGFADSGMYDVLLTYFNQANGDRLVVMQVGGWEGGRYRTEDYAWTLSGGRFAERRLSELLPPIAFEDFWPGQRRPPNRPADFYLRDGTAHFAWPKEGTTARFYITTPDYPGVTPQDIALYRRRTFTGMALVWDRQRGRFTRGELIPYSPDEDDEHQHR